MQLYKTTEHFKEVQKMLDEGVPIEQLSDALEEINDDFEAKAENILYSIKNILGDVDKVKAEETRLAGRRQSMLKQVESLKLYLIENMQAQSKPKIDNGIIKASLVKPKPILVLSDESIVPDNFKKITVSSAIDKKMLLQHLKDLPEGEVLEGASIGQSKQSLMIK